MSNADVTGQPQGLFPVFGLSWSLLIAAFLATAEKIIFRYIYITPKSI